MPDFVTEGSFELAVQGLVREMQSGFKGIHDRLDKLNGSVLKHEDILKEHERRLRKWDNGDRATIQVPLTPKTIGLLVGGLLLLGAAIFLGPEAALALVK